MAGTASQFTQLFKMTIIWKDFIRKQAVYKECASRSLDGQGVAFQVLMPEDSSSNPKAEVFIHSTKFVLVWAYFNPSGILTQP